MRLAGVGGGEQNRARRTGIEQVRLRVGDKGGQRHDVGVWGVGGMGVGGSEVIGLAGGLKRPGGIFNGVLNSDHRNGTITEAMLMRWCY